MLADRSNIALNPRSAQNSSYHLGESGPFVEPILLEGCANGYSPVVNASETSVFTRQKTRIWIDIHNTETRSKFLPEYVSGQVWFQRAGMCVRVCPFWDSRARGRRRLCSRAKILATDFLIDLSVHRPALGDPHSPSISTVKSSPRTIYQTLQLEL